MLGMMSLETALALLPGLVIGITVHEFAHAWSASLLGDDFPRRQGRVSLNPLRHLSPLGTMALFLLPIGWGRPVAVNLYNFRRPKWDYLLTSLAGPAANLVTAAVLVLPMFLTRNSFCMGHAGVAAMELTHELLRMTILMNIILAVLNLLPIPPLDGSKIWPCLIPGARPGMNAKLTWVFVVILVLLVSNNALSTVLDFPLRFVNSALPRSAVEKRWELRAQADAAIDSKQYALAEKLGSEELAIDPQADDAFYDRASARGWMKNWAGALEDMNQAIALRPDSAGYFEYRATILDAMGRHEEADKDRAVAHSLGHNRLVPASMPASELAE